MLINAPGFVKVLTLMEQAPFQFHLTGSRFFGYSTMESDWDFFVGCQENLRNWLWSNGFYHCDSGYQGTTGITEVWVHETEPIQIQTVNDAQLKADVQNVMNSIPFLVSQMRTMLKKDRKVLWDFAIASFSAGEKAGMGSVRTTAQT